MAVSLRETRNRIRSVTATAKITRAMELIAASRVMRAQANAKAASPYARELTRAVSAVASVSNVDHPLTTERPDPKRAVILIVSSDRGLAGAYSSTVIREGERLAELLRGQGKEVVPFLSGRKAVGYYAFRRREVQQQWTGFSEAPRYAQAQEIANAMLAQFEHEDEAQRVDEIHVVYTRFASMIRQVPEVIRLVPLEVVEGTEAPEPGTLFPLYEFEPSASEVLDALLPRYIASRVYYCLLQGAASELAARQRAMKSATDNANDLVERYTREANQARQAQITQEITEIVGGASSLSDNAEGE